MNTNCKGHDELYGKAWLGPCPICHKPTEECCAKCLRPFIDYGCTNAACECHTVPSKVEESCTLSIADTGRHSDSKAEEKFIATQVGDNPPVVTRYKELADLAPTDTTEQPHWTYTKDVTGSEYISLSNTIGRSKSAKTKKLRDNLLIDLDSQGKVIGVEILSPTDTKAEETRSCEHCLEEVGHLEGCKYFSATDTNGDWRDRLA